MKNNIYWGKLITLTVLAISTTMLQAQHNYWGSNPTPASPNQNQMPYQNTNSYNYQNQQVQQQNYGSFLKAEEQHMVDEINAVRTNPLAYIAQIENYIQTIEMDADFNSSYKQREIAAARELIEQLRRTPSMSSLQPHRGLYNAAISHGNDIKRQGRLNHTGSDGSQIWDRLSKVNGIVGGAENLVAGAHSAKESVIILLVDAGVPSRGHRKNILNPKWEYVADYVIGDVGTMPNAWIQLFGDSDGSTNVVAYNNNNQPTEYANRGWNTPTNTNNNWQNHQASNNHNNNWQYNQQATNHNSNNWQANNSQTYSPPQNNVTAYGIEVTPSNREFNQRGNYNTNTYTPNSYNYNNNPQNYNNATNNNNLNVANPSTPAVSSVAPSYMKSQEMAMINEINLMRSNPSAYIAHVEAYVTEFQTSGWDAATVREEVNTANELIQQLRNTPPLSILRPYESLHKVAIKHGQDVQRQGRIGHVGTDGSWPWDRVRKMTDLSDGGENLVGGGDNVRQSVIMLLVDSGIPSRGHRKALLDPKWEYVACYEIGMVGPQNDSWVQVFAK